MQLSFSKAARRTPDQQAGSVVKAGVCEIETITHPDGAGVGMISAHDWIAISWLRNQSQGTKRKPECSYGTR